MDETLKLLDEAHDMLHRLVAVFVSDMDGAHKQTTDLMRRIREHLGDEFNRDVGCPDCNGTGENPTLTGCCGRCGGKGELRC